MPRRIRTPEKKLRGIPRRIRSLQKWGDEFSNFPSQNEIESNDFYWNHELPTDWLLVEGRQSTQEIKRQVAQILLQACSALIKKKPLWADAYRITCCLCVPNMHSSEICIYRSEQYFQSKVSEAQSNDGAQTRIVNRTLSKEWGFTLPEHISERGTHWEYQGDADGWGAYASDHWFYGEVDD